MKSGFFGVVFNPVGRSSEKREALNRRSKASFILPPASEKVQIIVKGMKENWNQQRGRFKAKKDRFPLELL